MESVGSRRVTFVVQSEQDKILRYHVSLLTHCLNDGPDLCSGYQIRPLPLDVWPRVKAKARLGVLQQLKTWRFWRELPARGRSGALLFPVIPVAGGVRALSGAGEPQVPPRVFPETLVSDHNLQWCENLALISHLTKLQQVCDMKANPRRSRAFGEERIGEPSPQVPFTFDVDDRRVIDTESDNMADMVLSVSHVQYEYKTHDY